ncbi:MAG: hypothetical protein DRJ40_11655, partial [Thermoprotei archaeon]
MKYLEEYITKHMGVIEKVLEGCSSGPELRRRLSVLYRFGSIEERCIARKLYTMYTQYIRRRVRGRYRAVITCAICGGVIQGGEVYVHVGTKNYHLECLREHYPNTYKVMKRLSELKG